MVLLFGVHIWIVHSPDNESYLAAISRIVARRGQPNTKLSDNGTNLIGAVKQLKEQMTCKTQQKIKKKLTFRSLI